MLLINIGDKDGEWNCGRFDNTIILLNSEKLPGGSSQNSLPKWGTCDITE